jgi:hypothetical protein
VRSAWVRVLFCLSASLLAAAIADIIVETASNSGLFGSQNFTDHSTLDILPTIFGAMLLVGACIAFRVYRAIATTSTVRQSVRRAVEATTIGSTLPWIFTTQILVLFTMENIEQLVVYGHALGGTIWLGGPIAVALFVHAVFCVVVTFSLASLLRALSASLTQIIGSLLRFLPALEAQNLFARAFSIRTLVRCVQQPTLCRIGERAPPK